MVGNILTGSQQSQLLAIQSAQRTIDRVQQNLATGKDVNNALQDPQNFFTSRALNNRASDLTRLLDNIGQGIKAIDETATGVEAILKLLNQADALLNEAELELYPNNEPLPNIIVDSLADLSSYVPSQDFGGLVTIDNDGKSIKLDGNLWKKLELDYTITENTVLRFDYQSSNIPEIVSIGFEDDNNLTNSINRFYIYGTQSGGFAVSAPEPTFQYTGSGEVETIEIPVGEYFEGNFNFLTLINDDDGPGDDGDSRFDNITLFESNDVVLPIAKKKRAAEYEADYNEILKQIDLIVKDANYRGINLLEDENLTIAFNEQRTSTLVSDGIDASSLGLGIIDADFGLLSTLQKSREHINNARLTLRKYTSTLQTDLSIVTARQDFTRNIINTLQNGRDDLTLADQNEEGANLLALQTRQSIQFSTLAFSSQTRSVAELF
ncbi:MAG: hypothetical protein GW778_05780 [Alphaproteobacteria bacterium]|nr:hypothetical protein [Alphaproteobacteria bacterium]